MRTIYKLMTNNGGPARYISIRYGFPIALVLVELKVDYAEH